MASTGLSNFGIVRKRMSDLYADFAERIKVGGAFGPQTTLDAPDQFAGDPLVQLASAASASTHELWEAVEQYYNQFNIETASGVFLDQLHGFRAGVVRVAGQSDDDYRGAILSAIRDLPSRFDPVAVAVGQPDVECAAGIVSTDANGCRTYKLVIRGCKPDYEALAQQLYDFVDLGVYELTGDVLASVQTPAGGCVTYRFEEARPILIAVRVEGIFQDDCSDNASVRAAINTALTAFSSNCGFGGTFDASTLTLIAASIEGFDLRKVTVARRARQLVPEGCDTSGLLQIELCGDSIAWASSNTCGADRGEVWCDDDFSDCALLEDGEYPIFNEQLIEIVEATPC